MKVVIAVVVIIIILYIIYKFFFCLEKQTEKEIVKREISVYNDKCKVEKAKQQARVAGDMARKNIDNIARLNDE